jgi:hypothetical protein
MGEILLELRNPGAGPEPAGAQAGLDLGDLSLLDTRGAKDEKGRLGVGMGH